MLGNTAHKQAWWRNLVALTVLLGSTRKQRVRTPSMPASTASQERKVTSRLLVLSMSRPAHHVRPAHTPIKADRPAAKIVETMKRPRAARHFVLRPGQKCVTMAVVVVVPIVRLFLKRAQQGPTVKFHLRISAWNVQRGIQARKRQPNVNLGKVFLKNFFFHSFYFSCSPPHHVASSPLSFFPLLLHLTTSATRVSSIPTPAVHAPSAPQDSSKIKTPTQVPRAKHVQLDTTATLTVPLPAPISVASNPLTARTTSTIMSLSLIASAVLAARPVSVPLILHKSKQNLDGSSVPIILKNLRSVLFQVHALEDPTQHSRINSLMPRKMILLSVPTAQKNVTTSMGMPTAPDFAGSARPTTAWMVSVGSVRNVHPSRKTWRSA